MSEHTNYGIEVKTEDFPPLYPISEIVGNIVDKGDDEVASLRAQYVRFLEHDGIMPHARETAEKIIRLIDFELECRNNETFAKEVEKMIAK